MSLADYQPLRREIPLRGGSSVSVRGLSLDDVAVLMNLYLRDIDALFNLYDEVDEASQVRAMAQFAVVLCREAPTLVAHAIALVCDEPDHIDKARLLGLPKQVEILKAVFEMTFEEAGGARKFIESLGMLLQTLAPAVQKTGSPT